MMEILNKIREKVTGAWNSMKPVQKIITGSLMGGVIIALALSFYVYSKPQMVTLINELDLKQIADIREQLVKNGRTFKLGEDGKSILVLATEKQDILADLASENLIEGGNIVGLEIFDRFRLGETDYERKVNYLRGVTGELERILRKFPHVKEASVEVPLIEDTIWTDKQQKLTASVTLFLEPTDYRMTTKQVTGIKKLVANSIAGLSEADVALFDQESVELVPIQDEEASSISTNKVPLRLQIQNREANRLKRLIDDHLGRALTRNKVEVMVKVEMLWDKISKSSVIRDLPEWMQPKYGGQPIQLKVSRLLKDEELKGEGIRPEGEPGIKPNEPAYKFVNDKGEVLYKSHEERDNFMDPSVFEQAMEKAADFRRITASVLIDGTWQKKILKDGTIERKYIPRDEEFLKSITEIVRGAIGADEARGDQVYVKNIQFDRAKEFEKEQEELRRQMLIRQSIIWALIITVFLFVTTMVFRELARRRRIREEELARLRELERQKALAEAGEMELTLEEQERLELIKRAETMARQKPEMVAAIIRTWMQADIIEAPER